MGKCAEVLYWMGKMAVADGVVTDGEIAVIEQYAKLNGIDCDKMVKGLKSRCDSIVKEVVPIRQEKSKGTQFEGVVAYTIGRSEDYTLKEWRGDKYIKGVYAESNKAPDLYVIDRKRHLAFYVECKYRSAWRNGSVTLGRDKLNEYKLFQKQECKTVFIALGVGGSPTKPEELYLIPVDKLSRDIVRHEEIKHCGINLDIADISAAVATFFEDLFARLRKKA